MFFTSTWLVFNQLLTIIFYTVIKDLGTFFITKIAIFITNSSFICNCNDFLTFLLLLIKSIRFTKALHYTIFHYL